MTFDSPLSNTAKVERVLEQHSILFYGVEDGRIKSVRAAPPFIIQDWI